MFTGIFCEEHPGYKATQEFWAASGAALTSAPTRCDFSIWTLMAGSITFKIHLRATKRCSLPCLQNPAMAVTTGIPPRPRPAGPQPASPSRGCHRPPPLGTFWERPLGPPEKGKSRLPPQDVGVQGEFAEPTAGKVNLLSQRLLHGIGLALSC